MRTAIVLFTRDLRVHDNPALAAAADAAEHVLPLFVLDDEILERFGAPNRNAFLGEALRDLEESLAGLVVRRGDTVAEVVRLAREADACAVFIAEDAGAFAKRRERLLREQLELRVFPSHSVVAIDDVRTTSGTGYRIFTPYWRAWREAPRRTVLGAPRITIPPAFQPGRMPHLGAGTSPDRVPGGERAARERLAWFVDERLAGYDERADDLAADFTSRLSPYLHFGCLSARELEERTQSCEAFVRQLCWRDFFLQLLAANPSSVRDDLRPREVAWRRDPDALQAWMDGRTGYPIVDAAMRQLRNEGWLPNRARLIVGSFLTKTLRIDWREGARHFFELLVDGDLASNTGNWQWIGGTGADTRPNRVLNPLRQAARHDPDGDYVRRHLPELSGVPGRAVHTPWKLDSPVDYPPPLVEALSRA